MKKPMVWNSWLALTGLGALLLYILACTSFSSDDSKLLYLTIDARSGMTAVAVYDRKTAKSEMLFEPVTQASGNVTVANFTPGKPALMRPQWLEGGHDFLASWTMGLDDSDKTLYLAVLPYDRRGLARTFQLSDLAKDASSQLLYWPLPVVGSSVFLIGESNSLVRLNLETGKMHRQTNQQQLIPLPSPDNDRIFYLLGGANDSNGPSEFGLLNPETFARTPMFQIKDQSAIPSISLSRDTKRLAYLVENENPQDIHVLETGQPARTLSLPSLGTNTQVLIYHFSLKGDILYGSFRSPADGANANYGFVEIPLDGSTIRQTTLISNAASNDKDMFPSFQIDISHDGKTLAVESLWFAYQDPPIKAGDCALFLVDLADPQRRVTKVPIPLPPRDQPSPFK
jgi:hypothetical protein